MAGERTLHAQSRSPPRWPPCASCHAIASPRAHAPPGVGRACQNRSNRANASGRSRPRTDRHHDRRRAVRRANDDGATSIRELDALPGWFVICCAIRPCPLAARRSLGIDSSRIERAPAAHHPTAVDTIGPNAERCQAPTAGRLRRRHVSWSRIIPTIHTVASVIAEHLVTPRPWAALRGEPRAHRDRADRFLRSCETTASTSSRALVARLAAA